jgi:hypothetical protein
MSERIKWIKECLLNSSRKTISREWGLELLREIERLEKLYDQSFVKISAMHMDQ